VVNFHAKNASSFMLGRIIRPPQDADKASLFHRVNVKKMPLDNDQLAGIAF
jgi:hypothetical protein